MELVTAMAALCVSLSFLLCVSSHEVQHVDAVVASTLTTKLPRKLRPFQDPIGKAYKSEAFIPDTHKKGTLPGRPQTTRVKLDGRSGTRQKWIEDHMWEYFTMDYRHVRRRRPIHNKSIRRGR